MRCQTKQTLQERGEGRDPAREKIEGTRHDGQVDTEGREEGFAEQTRQVFCTYCVFSVLGRASGPREWSAKQNKHESCPGDLAADSDAGQNEN